jgi:protein-S-isoprenylcysteine O-methyltransferase Ste14
LYNNPGSRYAGDAITFFGLLFTVWARVHLGLYWSGEITLKVGHRLIRTGPYRLVRHPIYTGFLLAALGSAISAATGDALLGAVLVILALVVKLRREESLLIGEFGDEYRQFKLQTPALLPLIY